VSGHRPEISCVQGPARTFSPINVWDTQLKEGQHIEMDFPEGYTTLLAILKGKWSSWREPRQQRKLAILDRVGSRIPSKRRRMPSSSC